MVLLGPAPSISWRNGVENQAIVGPGVELCRDCNRFVSFVANKCFVQWCGIFCAKDVTQSVSR